MILLLHVPADVTLYDLLSEIDVETVEELPHVYVFEEEMLADGLVVETLLLPLPDSDFETL